jgi:two-component system, cell cycle response regulator
MPETIEQILLRLVLESLPLGICVVNRDYKIVFWSEGAEKQTGYLRQDVVGRSCRGDVLWHCDVEGNAMEATAIPLIATLREGRAAAGQVSLRLKDGQFVPVRIQTVPLREDGGSLIGAAEIFEPISAHNRPNRRQKNLSAYGCMDTLTGVFNHGIMQAHLKESLTLHQTYPIPFCVMCFSIDQIGELQKRYGQAGVDAALRSVAQTLESALRPTDFLGRWLDQEFIAIVIECRESDVTSVGERLARMVRSTGIPWWGDKIHVTVSVGATPVCPDDTMGSIVGRAERALQDSLIAGGNRVTVIAAQ